MSEAPNSTFHTIVSVPDKITHHQLLLVSAKGRDLGMHASLGTARRFFVLSAKSVAEGSLAGLKTALNGTGILSIEIEDPQGRPEPIVDAAFIAAARDVISDKGYRHAPERDGRIAYVDNGSHARWRSHQRSLATLAS